jgi:hypothetical protein
VRQHTVQHVLPLEEKASIDYGTTGWQVCVPTGCKYLGSGCSAVGVQYAPALNRNEVEADIEVRAVLHIRFEIFTVTSCTGVITTHAVSMFGDPLQECANSR